MLQHVPFKNLGDRHLEWLAKSLLVCPEDIRPEPSDFIRAVMAETMRLFEWDTGCVLVGAKEKRLVVFAFCTDPGISMELCRDLAVDLKKLAADWQCDKIETNCFDTHFASVIKHLGGRVESQTLVMEVPSGQ